MPIRLNHGWQKWSLVSVVLLIAALYLNSATRMLRAARAASDPARGSLERAAGLEPLNAAHLYRLGRQAFVVDQNLPRAIAYYRRAVELDPLASHYWLDLAVAYNAAGDEPSLRAAVDRALAADPRTPENLWRAANLLILTGDNARGFSVLRDLIAARPEYSADAVSLAWRATRDAGTVLHEVVPPQPTAQLAFLKMMLQQKQPEAAARAWQALVASGQSFAAAEAFAYVEYLLSQNDGARARDVWKQLARFDGSFAPYVTADGLVVNGGFELPVVDRALDWRHASRPGVTLDTNGEPHNGKRALAIELDGTPREFGIEQWVAVDPGTTYLVRGFYKAESEGVGMPRLGIFTLSGDRIGLSDEMSDSKDWKELRGVFATGAGQSVIILRVVREPGTTRIRGRFLLDDLTVAPEK